MKIPKTRNEPNTRLWTGTSGRRGGHFTCLDHNVPQIFLLLIFNGEKILSNVNVVV